MNAPEALGGVDARETGGVWASPRSPQLAVRVVPWGAQARFRPPALRAVRSQVTAGGRIMRARLRRSARTFLEKPPTGKARSSLGCAHFAPREVPNPRVFFLVTSPAKVSPPKPAGRPFAAGFGVRVDRRGGRADSRPSYHEKAGPGLGRRNRGRRLASSTPADGKRWAGAARPGAGHPLLGNPLAAAGKIGRRGDRLGAGEGLMARSVQSAAPPGCDARPAALRPGGALVRQPRTARKGPPGLLHDTTRVRPDRMAHPGSCRGATGHGKARRECYPSRTAQTTRPPGDDGRFAEYAP